MKVVVIGAGVMGASTALSLVRGGADVTLVEMEAAGSGTSSRGAGLVSEAMWNPTSLRLVKRTIEILETTSREGQERGHPFRFHQVGSSTLLPPRLIPHARKLAKMQQGEGADVREVAARDVEALPRHSRIHVDDVALALHYPRDGWALPRLFSEVAAHTAHLLGARVLRGAARVVRAPERIEVRVGAERIAVDGVVVAAGVWTRRVLREAGLDAPLLAYRTQALRLGNAHAEGVPAIHDAVQGFYLRPGIPQHLVAGDGTSTTPEDIDRWQPQADPGFVELTLRRLHHRFPYLPTHPRVEAWAGIDAATPDRLLLAGTHPDDPRIWLLAGGNGHGFMRAPAAGESLAAIMLGRTPPVDIAAFAPSRFPDMSMDFSIREGFSIEDPEPSLEVSERG